MARFRPRQRLRTSAEFDRVFRRGRASRRSAVRARRCAERPRARPARARREPARRWGRDTEPRAAPAARELPQARARRAAERRPRDRRQARSSPARAWRRSAVSSAPACDGWRRKPPGAAARALLLLVDAYRVGARPAARRSLPFLAELQRLRAGGDPRARRRTRNSSRRPTSAQVPTFSSRGL